MDQFKIRRITGIVLIFSALLLGFVAHFFKIPSNIFLNISYFVLIFGGMLTWFLSNHASCPHCRKKIGKEAKQCLHCGEDWHPEKHKILKTTVPYLNRFRLVRFLSLSFIIVLFLIVGYSIFTGKSLLSKKIKTYLKLLLLIALANLFKNAYEPCPSCGKGIQKASSDCSYCGAFWE